MIFDPNKDTVEQIHRRVSSRRRMNVIARPTNPPFSARSTSGSYDAPYQHPTQPSQHRMATFTDEPTTDRGSLSMRYPPNIPSNNSNSSYGVMGVSNLENHATAIPPPIQSQMHPLPSMSALQTSQDMSMSGNFTPNASEMMPSLAEGNRHHHARPTTPRAYDNSEPDTSSPAQSQPQGDTRHRNATGPAVTGGARTSSQEILDELATIQMPDFIRKLFR